MAPKKKGSKKQQEDWEAELGETIPAATATAPDAAADDENKDDTSNDAKESNDNKNEEDGMSGGLLAALKKNRSKKAKRGKGADNDFVEGEDPMAAMDESKQPQEASFEDDEEDVFSGNAATRQRAKEKAAAMKEKAKEAEEEGGRVKSKKEKEKEKKEREKQRKKEQAAKKKTTTPAAAPAPKAEPAKPVAEEKPVAPAAAPAADTGAKKKKLPAHLAAIQRQQEALRKQQEEIARLEAEERAAAEEQQRKLEEEERKKEEIRQRRKEKEREKKEQLRKEGKLLTKAQKEAQQRNELRKQQMLAAGAVVQGLEEPVEKKKPVYENKKKRAVKKQEDDLEAAAARAEAQRLELEAARAKQAEEERKRAEEEAAAQAAAESAAKEADDDGIKESWDISSDEEEEEAKADGGTKTEANGATNGEPSAEQSEEESSSEEDEEATANQRAIAQRKAEAAERRKQQHEEALAARSADNLRSPICCILGHVDTGKTKLLDKVRQTNVQEGEAGGITQQIGATYFPTDALKQKTAVVNKDGSFEFKVPGLLVIDTPGHESFSNLRSRGSSLCNIAILVVDIMHGLEPQTLESMKLLRDRKTPFIVALNKIDRLYGWKKIDNNGFQDSLALQNKGVQNEFRDRVEKTKLAFAEQGFNSELYWENKSMARNVSLVPTSAHTGEGVPDMLKLLIALTQERMTKQLMYLTEVECTVLEVKVIEGLGTTIDVILSNGVLREGDRIVMCGLNGAIATNIRALLTPAPLKELRLKSQYVHNKEVKAALGVKIAANDLEHAIAGSRLLVVGPDDDEEDLEDEVMSDLESLLSKVSKDNRGVSVQASTLGSLEALLEFLRVSKVPVANISIGPVYKRDVMRAGTMLEKAKQFAVMLCFDVKVDKEAQAYADEVGIKIFTADIIYHLFDDFTKHMEQIAEQKKEESKLLAVFPCVLNTVAVFNKKDPIVIGVDVVEGSLRLLTPIAAVKVNPVTGVREVINLGRVQSIEREHKQIPLCKKGQPSVAVKIEGPNQPLYGRQLEEKDTLYSLISRPSIDTLKEFYRADVSMDEWVLIKKLKPLFDIP
ncbi:translation initiation factor aIF-2 [Emergomyces africanus]|uniref:Eukaryotic translation initiation factor 5B n=1 Tax=Emergomyces africanus TaxID=1955775 RepID=A0A1B7NNT8_9EURO|nr:translation initiation factor aIF-2 [Emergomyces africanus]